MEKSPKLTVVAPLRIVHIGSHGDMVVADLLKVAEKVNEVIELLNRHSIGISKIARSVSKLADVVRDVHSFTMRLWKR